MAEGNAQPVGLPLQLAGLNVDRQFVLCCDDETASGVHVCRQLRLYLYASLVV